MKSDTEKRLDLFNSILWLSLDILNKDQREWTMAETIFMNAIVVMRHEFLAEREALSRSVYGDDVDKEIMTQ